MAEAVLMPDIMTPIIIAEDFAHGFTPDEATDFDLCQSARAIADMAALIREKIREIANG